MQCFWSALRAEPHPPCQSEIHALPVLPNDVLAQRVHVRAVHASLAQRFHMAYKVFIHVALHYPRVNALCLLSEVEEVVRLHGDIVQKHRPFLMCVAAGGLCLR